MVSNKMSQWMNTLLRNISKNQIRSRILMLGRKEILMIFVVLKMMDMIPEERLLVDLRLKNMSGHGLLLFLLMINGFVEVLSLAMNLSLLLPIVLRMLPALMLWLELIM